MKTKLIEKEFNYDGSQLHSLFSYLEHGLQGDSIVAWIGPCSIPFEHMVDGEDVVAKNAIRGGRMLHFISEIFHENLFGAVALQRLFASICLDLLRELVPSQVARMRRDGDDLFIGDGKLSISIATVSPVSALLHFALNITNENTPVKTAALGDLGVDPKAFALEAMKRFEREVLGVQEATVKVRWVK